MKPRMLAIERTFDPDVIDNKLTGLAKVPYSIQVSLMKGMAEGGYGKVTVDGIELSRGAVADAMGFKLLLIPVGEVARDYDKEYEVKITDFIAENGKKYADMKFKLKTTSRTKQDPAYAEHDEQALNAAREAMVLLKNEGNVLPLKADATLNCFGIAQYMYRITATGASLINPRWKPSFMQAVSEHSSFTLNKEVSSLYKTLRMAIPKKEELERAKAKNDTAIIMITRTSGEFQDNKAIPGHYYLSEEEEQMVEAVTSVFDKTVAIINTGYPIDMNWTKKYGINSILYTGFCGMLSSYALVEILDGRTNPSGKLPDTWSWDYFDNPVSKNFVLLDKDEFYGESGKGVELYYEEDIYVGYRYFDTFQKEVAFSFGHGLSYTTFESKIIAAQTDLTQEKESVVVKVEVTNTGKVKGKEVIQLYVSAPDGKLEKPAHVLAGFEKTKELAPGESQILKITADRSVFASFEEETARYILEKGNYIISVGNALDHLKVADTFSLKEEIMVRQCGHHGAPVEDFKRLTKADPTVDGSKSRMVEKEERVGKKAPRPEYHPEPLPKYAGKRIMWSDLKANPPLLDSFVAQMTDDELCTMNVCAGAQWAPWQNGCAGITAKMNKYKMPRMQVADANAGWNLTAKNIGFPASSMIAATFNKEIAYTVGKVIAEEGKDHDVMLNLGPGMNLHRDTLNGRHPEYFSEDPYLTGVMAGHHGKGLQENGIGCCYKHTFCNNSEACRKASHSIVSERALRELYFKSFEIAFGVHKATSIMTSYNAMNGIYPGENADLLQNLIRGEWGFDGYIMSDWDSYETVDTVEMVKAGNCWITAGGSKYVKQLQQALKAGKVERAVLEHNVRWLVKVMLEWDMKRTLK